jgi:hypothetical protein
MRADAFAEPYVSESTEIRMTSKGREFAIARFCKRRTGSAFGVAAYFPKASVGITKGTLKLYEYQSDEPKRWLKMEFCPTCGTTVTWTAEWNPSLRAIAVGTFDDPNWLTPRWEIYARSGLRWVTHPVGVDTYDTDPYINPGGHMSR